MEKAYDLKELIKEVKGEGLEIAEESAKALAKGVFSWLKKSAAASENKIDDMLAPGYAYAESFVMEQADKINPQDNA